MIIVRACPSRLGEMRILSFVSARIFLKPARAHLAVQFPPTALVTRFRQRALCRAWKLRSTRNALLGLVVLFSICLRPISASVTLQIPDVNLPDGKVEFRPGVCDSVGMPAVLPQQMPETTTNSYVVMVDLVNTTHGSYGYFVYPIYVHSNSGNGRDCVFHVQVLPSGTFVDKMADVSFHVGEGTVMEDGTTRIPLYNFAYSKSILQGHAGTKLSSVSLNGETTLDITLSNVLADLAIGLYPDVTVSPEHGSYWDGGPKAILQLPHSSSRILNAAQTLDGAVALSVRPNPWHALGASIFPLAPDKPHETMTVYVNYDTPGGVPGTLEIPVAIRFRPSFWSLILAVFAGAIAGSLLAQLGKKPGADDMKWYRAFAVALLASVIAEVLGIMLVYGGSEFRLFGFELDPYQLLPVAAVGALVGLLGFRNADDFLKRFQKGDPTSVKGIAILSIVALLLGFTGGAQAQMASQVPLDKAQGPVAISALPSGTLAVLGGRGRLSLIEANSGRMTLIKDALGYFFPADMVATHLNDTDSIFIALNNTLQRQGVLAKYSLAGKQEQTWFGRTGFAGVAIDTLHHTIYLGDAVTGEISSLSIDGSSTSPSFFAEISGVARLGPLAVDGVGQRVFAADVGGGTIYVLDLHTRKSHLLASGMGEPAAISYDAEQKVLYVADASRHCIWTISTDSPKSTTSIFSSAPELREPRGITVDEQHTVWVADHGALAVFKLSASGSVVQRISP